jgi:sirohydrochlorin ferrochelatase
MTPRLLAVAHGTRSASGQAQICDLVDAVAARRPGLDVRLAYVDVQHPRLPDAIRLPTGPVVVVPLLLSSGYHVRVDIARAVTATPGAVATPPLGPDDWPADVLAARIAAAGPADAVVLAAAGSSDPRSRADVEAVARALPMPARVGYATTSEPRVPDVVAQLRAEGARRVVVAAYLLADGQFYRSLRGAGADAVTAPLVTAPVLPSLVLRRYDDAVAGTGQRAGQRAGSAGQAVGAR